MRTPQVKEIRIHRAGKQTWVEYEMKTTTNVIPCLGWSDAVVIAQTLDKNVKNWLTKSKKEETTK